jgi:hypothetical protein
MNQLKQGSNFASNAPSQYWKGNGIITSLGGDGSTGYTAVGAIYNDLAAANKPAGPLYTQFDGHPVTVDDVLIKYTYFGDSDLDGAVTTNDYFQIDNGFLNSRTGWINGDFDYDGAVTTIDYFAIDNAFLNQGAPLVPAAASTEPLAASVMAAAPTATLDSGVADGFASDVGSYRNPTIAFSSGGLDHNGPVDSEDYASLIDLLI